MKIAFAFLLFVCTGVNAQFYLDSVKWNLHSNNSVSDSTFCGRGSDQVIGSGIGTPAYVNSYQKITKPGMGWTNSLSGSTVNSPNAEYIQFPNNVTNYFPVTCSTGVGVCYDYCTFLSQKLRLKAYRSATGSDVVMKVNVVRVNGFYSDVGNITISSTDPLQPTIIEIPLYYHYMDYRGLRLYPLQGDDFYIKEVSIIGQRGASLPVRFIDFTASKRDESVHLAWTIDLNIAADSFFVEHSVNGADFRKVHAMNFRPGQNEYKWQDLHLENENYYRIKAVEKSGFVTFTNIIRVSALKSNSLMVFPNPVTGNALTLRSAGLIPGMYTVKLVDQMGRTIFAGTVQSNQPGLLKAILPQSKQGVYILSVNNKNINLRQRILVR